MVATSGAGYSVKVIHYFFLWFTFPFHEAWSLAHVAG
jgi:hypothetical protein